MLLKLVPLLFAHLQQKRAEWFNAYPRITPGWMRTFLVDWAYSSDKARRELGYQPTPLLEGIRITYEWLLRVRRERSKEKSRSQGASVTEQGSPSSEQ